MCLKDEKITAEHLQNHVQGRTYDKEQHPDTFGDSFVWTEKYTANTTLPLPKTVDGVDIIWPGTDASYGNVTWAFCSITAALREERQLKTYKDFDLKLGNTLDVYMPDWWTKIPTPGKIPMHQQN